MKRLFITRLLKKGHPVVTVYTPTNWSGFGVSSVQMDSTRWGSKESKSHLFLLSKDQRKRTWIFLLWKETNHARCAVVIEYYIRAAMYSYMEIPSVCYYCCWARRATAFRLLLGSLGKKFTVESNKESSTRRLWCPSFQVPMHACKMLEFIWIFS
jgi:hypothetical protein